VERWQLDVLVLDKLPLHLKELYECSVAALDGTEHQEVHQLLCEFAGIFSTGPHDLDLVKVQDQHW